LAFVAIQVNNDKTIPSFISLKEVLVRYMVGLVLARKSFLFEGF